MAARAYPEISVLLNAGRCKLTKKERLRNKRIKTMGPKAPINEAEERRQAEAAMWKCFPVPPPPLDSSSYGSHLKKVVREKPKPTLVRR